MDILNFQRCIIRFERNSLNPVSSRNAYVPRDTIHPSSILPTRGKDARHYCNSTRTYPGYGTSLSRAIYIHVAISVGQGDARPNEPIKK